MKIVLLNPFVGQTNAETELGIRMVKALEFLGHQAIETINSDEINQIDPDLVLSLHPSVRKRTKHPTYGCLWCPPQHYSEWGLWIEDNVASYDGYFYGAEPTSKWTEEMLLFHEKAASLGLLLPTCNQTNFQPGKRLRSGHARIAYFGTNWDGDRHRRLFEALDRRGLVDFYGKPAAWHYLQSGYKGIVPFDGKAAVNIYREAGAGLCMHAAQHIDGAVPSQRIFEITAASAIAICDRHPFVERVFDDTVLYIDSRDQARSIYEHLSWINENQSAALQMAERAHSIFLNFSLEHLLDKAVVAHTARLNSIKQRSEERWVTIESTIRSISRVGRVLRLGGRSPRYQMRWLLRLGYRVYLGLGLRERLKRIRLAKVLWRIGRRTYSELRQTLNGRP